MSNELGKRCIIGIDEVGRGAMAGPVVVAGVFIKLPFRFGKMPPGVLKDSKKLTSSKREEWFGYLTSHPDLYWASSRVTPKVIDRINITKAANLAAYRLIKKLAVGKNFFAYLDGGLSLPNGVPYKAIIKGDEKLKIIAAASIIAKVIRDHAMTRLHGKDPRYRFDVHKGYGTKFHKSRIGKFGYSKAHRKSFVFNK